MTSAEGVDESMREARRLMTLFPAFDGLALGAVSDRFVADCVDGQLAGVNWTVAVAPDSAEDAFMNMLALRWIAESLSDKCLLARTVADIHEAHRNRKVAVVAGWQGGDPLGGNFHWLEVFAEYGLRVLQLCYNHEDKLGYGCLEPHDMGLKRFGIEVVRECNRLGLLIDLSHTGARTTFDAMMVSDAPCIFSHSNPRAIHNNPRNITDDQIRACAEAGGVIGTLPCTAFITAPDPGRRATLEQWVACVDHVTQLVGIDHVGIGSDLSAYPGNRHRWNASIRRRYPDVNEGIEFETRNVAGIDSHADFPKLIAALIRHGYQEQELAKIMGGNWLRVFSTVWKA